MTFRLLYPDPDAATVAGPGNATFWLMLFVRSSAIHQFRGLHYASVAIEVVAVVVGYALHLRGLLHFWRLRAIHANFMILAAGMYSVLIIGAASRLLLILFEIKIVPVQDLSEFPIPSLATLRQASCSHVSYILWVWTIERTCATIYVADYERKPRLHISILLNAIITIASFATGYAVVTKRLNCIYISLIAFMPNFACAILFRWLIRYNERRLARLTDQVKRHPDEYSLSLRLQLKENIWSMRKIEFGVYLLTAGLASNMSLALGPILVLTAPDQFALLQWLSIAGNLGFALFILFSSPWLEVAIAIHTGKNPPILRAILGRKKFSKKVPIRLNEMDEYFNQLDNQWNSGLTTLKARVVDA